jgi:predicted N-acetyltransferase YhbS
MRGKFTVMHTKVRQEVEQDYEQTKGVVEKAFLNAKVSTHREHIFVARLRKSKTFVPELSLIAELENSIIGQILFTKIVIQSEDQTHESLALAVVSVLPEYQKQGVGRKLITEGLKKATELGFKSVIVVGHPDYYPQFGFRPAKSFGIKAPFDCPDDAFMALELVPGSLASAKGTVIYPEEFLP